MPCPLCKDLKPGASGLWAPFDPPPKQGIFLTGLQQSSHHCSSGGCKILLQAIIECVPGALEQEMRLLSTLSSHSQFRILSKETNILHSLQIFVMEGKRHTKWPAIVRSVQHQDLTSDSSLSFVRERFEECERGHSQCRSSLHSQAFMPSRILDLGTIDDSALEPYARAPIRLLESDSSIHDTNYVCLSHRWGSWEHTIVTKSSTLARHKSGIPFQDLGTVYQDVVHILRRMGIRYLWVDSLCIIQDNEEDWSIESKIMAKIYSSALFTVARQCDDSCSISVRRLETQSYPVSDQSTSQTVYARSRFPHIWNPSHTKPGLTHFPLLSRGWVYQERLLSRRVVHFSNHEISWECGEVQTCQCGWADREQHVFNRPKLEHAEALGLGDPGNRPDPTKIKQRWRRMLCEYSGLQLTFATDRLPAIQGCVEQIAERIGDRCFLGLWKESLLEDLLWSVSARVKPEKRPLELLHIPTWSWASICSKVEYDTVHVAYARADLTHAVRGSGEGQTSLCLTITGHVLPAWLKVEAVSASAIESTTGTQGFQANNDGVELGIANCYVAGLEGSGLSSWSPHHFKADCDMQEGESSPEVRHYSVKILRVAGGHEVRGFFDYCLVIWDYGKVVPGSSCTRETEQGHPIYQRIGTIATLNESSIWDFEELGLERSEVGLEDLGIDWSKADEVTIALE